MVSPNSGHRLEAAADDRPRLPGGTIGAYLTGVAVTSAPWLLTTAVLTEPAAVSRAARTGDFVIRRALPDRRLRADGRAVGARSTSWSRATPPIGSTTAALDRIAAPLRRRLALTVVGFAVIGVGADGAAAGAARARAGRRAADRGRRRAVADAVGRRRHELAGGRAARVRRRRAAEPRRRARLERAWGSARSATCSASRSASCDLGAAAARGARALPANADESARLWPAFVEYRLLALSAFAYYLSIWADKRSSSCSPAARRRRSTRRSRRWPGSRSSRRSPGSTSRSRPFLPALPHLLRRAGGGRPLPLLQERAELVRAEAQRILRGAALVQLAVTWWR